MLAWIFKHSAVIMYEKMFITKIWKCFWKAEWKNQTLGSKIPIAQLQNPIRKIIFHQHRAVVEAASLDCTAMTQTIHNEKNK